MARVPHEYGDLFFNHQHAARDALFMHLRYANEGLDVTALGRDPVFQQRQLAAAHEDASQFIEHYPSVHRLFGSPKAEALAADFVGRL